MKLKHFIIYIFLMTTLISFISPKTALANEYSQSKTTASSEKTPFTISLFLMKDGGGVNFAFLAFDKLITIGTSLYFHGGLGNEGDTDLYDRPTSSSYTLSGKKYSHFGWVGTTSIKVTSVLDGPVYLEIGLGSVMETEWEIYNYEYEGDDYSYKSNEKFLFEFSIGLNYFYSKRFFTSTGYYFGIKKFYFGVGMLF